MVCGKNALGGGLLKWVAATMMLVLLAGCTGASNASRSLSFDATSDKAIVIIGTSINLAQREEVRAGRSLSTFWQEYDPETRRLIPGGKTFTTTIVASAFSAQPAYLKPTISVLELDPGAYALVGAGFPHLASSFVEPKKSPGLTDDRGRLQTWTWTVDPRRHINPSAEIDRQNFLFSVSSGEILYVGHFEFLKWKYSDSIKSLNYFQDKGAARDALASYPGISGIMVTFDPAKPPQSVSR